MSPSKDAVPFESVSSHHQLPKFQDNSEIMDLYDDFSMMSLRYALFSIVRFDKLSHDNANTNGKSFSQRVNQLDDSETFSLEDIIRKVDAM